MKLQLNNKLVNNSNKNNENTTQKEHLTQSQPTTTKPKSTISLNKHLPETELPKFAKNFVTKRNIGVLIGLAAVVAAVILGFNFINGSKVQQQNDTTLSSVMTVPTLNTLILYDFYNGCIGYHSYNLIDGVNDEYGTPIWQTGFAVYAVKGGEQNGWVSYYPAPSEPYYTPAAGWAPVSLFLSTKDLSDSVNNITEGDYTFYIFKIDNNQNNTIQIGDTAIAPALKKGSAMKDVDDGSGYAAEWIRHYPEMVSNLLNNRNVDISSNYWNNINYLGCYVSYSNDSSSDISPFYFVATNVNTWESLCIPASVNHSDINAINQYLQERNAQTLSYAIDKKQFGTYPFTNVVL